MLTVHHTIGLRQQLGTAKLHRDPACRYLRGAATFAEKVNEANITDRMRCKACWPTVTTTAQPGA